jgi:hypothetical protein
MPNQLISGIVALYVASAIIGGAVWFFVDDGTEHEPDVWDAALLPSRPAPRHGLSVFVEGYLSGASLGGWQLVTRESRDDEDRKEAFTRWASWPRAHTVGRVAGLMTLLALTVWVVRDYKRQRGAG